MSWKIRTKFIRTVGKSGLSFEEIACIGGIAEINLFKFAAGKLVLGIVEKHRLATILDEDVAVLFPENENEDI